MATKYVYMFAEGNESMRNLLGGKGANLCEMTNLDLPIPPGFIVTTEVCAMYNASGKVLSQEVKDQVDAAMAKLEAATGKRFGDENNPLLVSVRSGARASMPGMMDTVLNLGLNDVSAEAMGRNTNNPRFAYDSYRRFIMMFSDVVIGVDKAKFERVLDKFKEEHGYNGDTDLGAEDWKAVCGIFKEIFKTEMKKDFPQEAKEQLYEAIGAVFRSWDNERAFVYRRMNDIPYEWGTAVNVQSMVFGNMNNDSGSGVVFSRNSATGENKITGEFLMNAQGEDVVAGVRTPKPFDELEKEKPAIYNEFVKYSNMLEKHYRDMQDMEITIENDKLYFLQTRNGKRTGQAALQIALDLIKDGVRTEQEALAMVEPKLLDQLMHPVFDPAELKNRKSIGKGMEASPGAASGRVVFNTADAKAAADKKEKVVLVRLETSAEDLAGMEVAEGILTVKGGMTSHAALVARGMGKPCVSGCEAIKMNEEEGYFELGGERYTDKDIISIDGSTGLIYSGAIPTQEADLTNNANFVAFMGLADKYRTLKVRTNADNPKDAAYAITLGAEGIGLTRTEHMFFEPERISKMRRMILADTEDERKTALAELMPYQKGDFIGIYEAMKELPVTIRLLDPPLDEFTPKDEEGFADLAALMSQPIDVIKAKFAALHEDNPMMGHRGCRLAVSYPEIAEMQTQAIIEA
ncbi:MAG: pyruvate, phosphate dikinase, partial [Clostridiales bacterium]|nr:pyruvate, phosphate dikinase [Clostridiales bacterium]